MIDNKKTMYNKILIINLGGIGDILLSIPALKALRGLYPNAEICGLFTQNVSGFAGDLPYFNKVYIFNIESKALIPFKNILDNFQTLLILRRKHYDIAINMRTMVSKKSARKIKILLDIIKPDKIAGRDTDGLGYFYDIKIPETLIGEKCEMEYDIDMVKALGVNNVNREIDFKPKEDSVKTIEEILEKEGILRSDILIGIHPGGKLSHRWPKEYFVKMMDEICKSRACIFVITGGKEEVPLVNEISKNAKARVLNLAGKLNLQELAALIKRCNVFISNDTGPMHIAAVLKTPLAAIFGPGYIVRFDPRKISEKAAVLYKKAECAPCDKIVCDSMRCLKNILPEEVTAAVETLLII